MSQLESIPNFNILAESSDEEIIHAAKRYLAHYRSYEALSNVVFAVNEIELEHLQIDAWDALMLFQEPFIKNYAGSCYVVQNIRDESLSIDDVIAHLEELIEKGTSDENVYGHLGVYWLKKERKSKALNILRKGINNHPGQPLLRIFYCQQLAFEAANQKTVEKYLLPILNYQDFITDEIRSIAATQLYIFYLAINDMLAAAQLSNSHAHIFMECSVLLPLSYLSLNPDGVFHDPSPGLIAWGDKELNSFLDDSDMYVKTPVDVLDYRYDLLATLLLKAWHDPEIDFLSVMQELDQKQPNMTESIDQYTGYGKALFNLFAGLAECEYLTHDRDLWLILCFYTLEEPEHFPAYLRNEITRLYRSYPAPTLRYYYLKNLAWWGNRSDTGDELISLLYKVVCWRNQNDLDDLDSDYLYEVMAPKKDSNGPRPLPYFIDEFIQSFTVEEYPASFCDGVWSHIIRPAVTKDNSHQNPRLMRLIDVFNSLLPDSDPLFIKGWNLIQDERYIESMACFQRLIDTGKNWYNVYRNLSATARKMGDIQLAYNYEKAAHDNPDVTVPDDRQELLYELGNELQDVKENTALFEEATHFYSPKPKCQLQCDKLPLVQTLKLIAFLEYFAIPGTDQTRPLESLPFYWLPSAIESNNDATHMISDGVAYLTNSVPGKGLSRNDRGGFSVDYGVVTFAPNLEPIGNWPVQLSQLYKRLGELEASLSPEAIMDALLPLLAADLEDYALSRFEAYEISINFNPKFIETAEHCLALFPIGACYNIYYRAIEDAAAKQREERMSNQHTVNYALSLIRARATNAHNKNWNVNHYDRERYALPSSAVIQVITNNLGSLP